MERHAKIVHSGTSDRSHEIAKTPLAQIARRRLMQPLPPFDVDGIARVNNRIELNTSRMVSR